MAKVLLLALDPVFAAVIEDRLLVSGHASTLVAEPAVAVSICTEGQADLLVMSMELPGVSGLETIRQLRRQNETRSLPIVALSANDDSATRIEALRAGAEDYMSLPCDPEELLLRLDRLLGKQTALPVLKGDLASHPIWELLQYIQQSAKTGDLRISGSKSSGRLQLQRGKVVSARWEKLRGRDAMLAITAMKEGRFQLTSEQPSVAADTQPEGLHITEVLMEAAWIEDQLTKHREHSPATSSPLERMSGDLPTIEEAFRFLPIGKVFERLGQQPNLRLYDLMTEGFAAPQKIRLAVAWLAKHGAVSPVEESFTQNPMSTTEISSSVVLDVAVTSLLSAASKVGFDVAALPCLLLAEPGVWPELQQLPASVPGFLRNEALRALVEQTQQGRGGSATFKTDLGKLSLHVQPLSGARQLIEAIVPVCAGVLLWLDDAEEMELIQRVVERLEGSSGPAVGMLVACTPAAQKAASELTATSRKWTISTHAPRSLLGVMRLLQPQAS